MIVTMQSSKQDLLRRVPLFTNLSKRNLDMIARISDEVHMSADNVLTQKSDQGYEFIFIIEGKAVVERDGTVIKHLGENGSLGEVAIIDRKPRMATVRAETDTTLLVIDYRFFNQLLRTIPTLYHEISICLVPFRYRAFFPVVA